MFEKSPRPVFKPSVYQPNQRRWRVPRGIAPLFIGLALGASGVLFLQTNYGSQRLSIEQSEQLRSSLSAVTLAYQQLQTRLEEATQESNAKQAAHESLMSDLTQAQHKIAALSKDLVLFQAAIPPDPQGETIGIRAATFDKLPGQLSYQVLITRDTTHGSTFQGNLQLLIEGRHENGRVDTIPAPPAAISLESYNRAEGSLPLPDGFQARSVVIKVWDAAHKQQALRVYPVRDRTRDG